MLQSSDNSFNPKSNPASNPNAYNPVKTVTAPVDQATIGRTLVIKGEISGSEALYIDGRIEGKIIMPESRVTMGHAFRNALIPLVTLVALNFGALLGGVVVTETVFGLDGMGLYFINALNLGDPYPVMAWLMVTAVMVIVFNLIADVAYGYLDPRVRYD